MRVLHYCPGLSGPGELRNTGEQIYTYRYDDEYMLSSSFFYSWTCRRNLNHHPSMVTQTKKNENCLK